MRYANLFFISVLTLQAAYANIITATFSGNWVGADGIIRAQDTFQGFATWDTAALNGSDHGIIPFLSFDLTTFDITGMVHIPAYMFAVDSGVHYIGAGHQPYIVALFRDDIAGPCKTTGGFPHTQYYQAIFGATSASVDCSDNNQYDVGHTAATNYQWSLSAPQVDVLSITAVPEPRMFGLLMIVSALLLIKKEDIFEKLV